MSYEYFHPLDMGDFEGMSGALDDPLEFLAEAFQSPAGRIFEAGGALLNTSSTGGAEEPGAPGPVGAQAGAGGAFGGPMTVSQIQTALKSAGFDPGPIDGIFGGQTKSATAAFQRANQPQAGPVDGIPGPLTQQALQSKASGGLAGSLGTSLIDLFRPKPPAPPPPPPPLVAPKPASASVLGGTSPVLVGGLILGLGLLGVGAYMLASPSKKRSA